MSRPRTAHAQMALLVAAGAAAMALGKAYSRGVASEMRSEYRRAVTADDISVAITAHNEELAAEEEARGRMAPPPAALGRGGGPLEAPGGRGGSGGTR
ncbi:hypothetical protein MMPV_002060 [Pyropia vietnamensis]